MWQKPLLLSNMFACMPVDICMFRVLGNSAPSLQARAENAPHYSCPCFVHVQVGIGTDPYAVFQDADWALMIGAKPRGPGQERADLLDQNGRIFVEQVSTSTGMLGVE